MTEFSLLMPSSPSRLLRLGEVETAAEALRRGGLAVLPTETGHMLAALATSEPALLRAFAVKERALSHPMHVACASLAMAARYADLGPAARALLGAFTPGPLSVVVGCRPSMLPDRLVTLDGTVGIRVPDHPATLQVVEAVGAPLTATSLNRSGEESRPVTTELLASFDWHGLGDVPVVVDNDAVRFTSASTLVRVTGESVEVLREGPIDRAAVLDRLVAVS